MTSGIIYRDLSATAVGTSKVLWFWFRVSSWNAIIIIPENSPNIRLQEFPQNIINYQLLEYYCVCENPILQSFIKRILKEKCLEVSLSDIFREVLSEIVLGFLLEVPPGLLQ